MDVGLPRRTTDSPDPIKNPYALWVRDALEVAYAQVRCHAGQAVRRQKRLYDKRAVKRVFVIGDWNMTPRRRNANREMAGSLFSGVHHRLGDWCSVATGLTSVVSSLPGLEEDSETSWFSVPAAVRTD